MIDISRMFDQIFDGIYRSYELQKEGSGENFILVNQSLIVDVNSLSSEIKSNLLIDITLVFTEDGHGMVDRSKL